ncbi:succinate--CoA ligase subunit alpha [Blattabacterium cuenoti]|uniref:succinate--CoA ligase subunit alpha n=1 Tax=Blattabacterium cuenoti TaxID=1653831 RepID=UPI00163C9391|nr:succinate--CoA ligase subunit alpha [Blattabacterium cuenoti]
MSILINKNTKVIVQGLTGKEGFFHTEQMINYGTKIVGGVTPGKGGSTCLGVPIFNTVEDAVYNTGANVSVIFVPNNFVFDAILESIYTELKIIVCITEGLPVSDMMLIKSFIKNKKSRIIGPNCPGIISPEQSKVGIMPNSVFKKRGNIGILSRSGTLTYEAADQIIKMGYGISTAVGIGGDAILGSDMKEIVKLFFNDSETECIVMIGEIGGQLEIEVVKWINTLKYDKKKPIISFIAGQTAPKGKTMGHAGAIINKNIETAQEKMEIMKNNGIHVVKSPDNIGLVVSKLFNKK